MKFPRWLRADALLFSALLCALLAGLPRAWAAEPLRIAAAADLQPVLPPLLHEFTAKTGIDAEASFGSSATLATQIENGAPFDVFLAADTSFPERVVADKLATESKPVVYARGTLVLWARNSSPLLQGSGHPLSLEALRSPSLHTLAVANPDRAPYGRAARAALEHMGLLQALTPRLVTADNIAQAAQFASSGNAEAGLISLTSARSPGMLFQGQYVEVPQADYPPLLQGAVTLKRSTQQAAAQRFVQFLQSAPVREELNRKGLAAPE